MPSDPMHRLHSFFADRTDKLAFLDSMGQIELKEHAAQCVIGLLAHTVGRLMLTDQPFAQLVCSTSRAIGDLFQSMEAGPDKTRLLTILEILRDTMGGVKHALEES